MIKNHNLKLSVCLVDITEGCHNIFFVVDLPHMSGDLKKDQVTRCYKKHPRFLRYIFEFLKS